MGIGIFLKSFLPWALYVTGLVCAFIAMGGGVRWALMLATFLLPLRNVIDKIQAFPLGTQFIDILLLGAIIGWIVNTSSQNRKFSDKSLINGIAIVLVLYMTASLFRGDLYLYGTLNFNIHATRVQDWKNFCLFPLIFFIVFNNIRSKTEIKQIQIYSVKTFLKSLLSSQA